MRSTIPRFTPASLARSNAAGSAARAMTGSRPATARCRASDAGVNLGIVERMKLPIEVAPDGAALSALLARVKPDLVADALLGTGLASPVREPHRGLIEAMNASGLPIVAVDLPSGLDTDTGEPLGVCVRATFTVTFAAMKKGFANALEWTGPVEVVPIGCPV